MKVRIRYTKTGALRFVGHLDFMRCFQKMVARSGLSPIYSAGFSPHMEMSFASPLGVGMTSVGEYVDLELAYRSPVAPGAAEQQRLQNFGLDPEALPAPPSGAEILAALNAVHVNGVSFLSARLVTEEGRAGRAMALVRNAAYEITFPVQAQAEQKQLTEDWLAFLNRETIPVLKKTKKSEKTVDIRPLIRGFGGGQSAFRPAGYPFPDTDDDCRLQLVCASGSTENLKPETVLAWFLEETEHRDIPSRVTRIDLMTEDLTSLSETGEVLP